MVAPFLFSIDLEDIRTLVENGHRYADRVPASVDRYLEFLARRDMRCTFFTVGDVARRYPELVGRIVGAGHEIGCHSSDHVTLDRHDRESFREDLQRNLDDLRAAGAEDVQGFRAPMFSLTRETAWAYEVLAELGFRYSSSVLAARSPVYGWPGFSSRCTWREPGLWELPLSLVRLPLVTVPVAGGVYFRVLPFPLVRRLFRRGLSGSEPVVGYFHPYEVDDEQEWFLHPEPVNSRFYTWLMYRNRSGVFPRLERLLDEGATIVPYAEYVTRELAPRERESRARGL